MVTHTKNSDLSLVDGKLLGKVWNIFFSIGMFLSFNFRRRLICDSVYYYVSWLSRLARVAAVNAVGKPFVRSLDRAPLVEQ